MRFAETCGDVADHIDKFNGLGFDSIEKIELLKGYVPTP
jgi:hypothetical protein